MRSFYLFVYLFVCFKGIAQQFAPKVNDSISVQLFERGTRNVNKCTPWHHMQCVYITANEVYKDGSEGKSTRHWWRMSYIGRACSAQHGRVIGKIFEGFFAIPHYITMGIGNGIGYTVYLIRGSPNKIEERKRIRKKRKLLRKEKKMKIDFN